MSLPSCPYESDCAFLDDPSHIEQFSHPPNSPPAAPAPAQKDCPYGSACKFIGDPAHCAEYRHLERCPYGPGCKLRTSPVHEASFDHSSDAEDAPESASASASTPASATASAPSPSALPACPNRDLCYMRDRRHAATYSHPTGWTSESGFLKASLAASQANETARIQSVAVSGHDARPRCSYYSTCYRTNIPHATQEAHPQGWKPPRRPPGGSGRGVPGTAGASSRGRSVPSSGRPVCHHGMGCYQTNPQHAQRFEHPTGWYPGLVPKPGARTGRPSVPPQARGPRPAAASSTLCQYGMGCYQMDPQHARDFVHPQGWVPKAFGRGRGGF